MFTDGFYILLNILKNYVKKGINSITIYYICSDYK